MTAKESMVFLRTVGRTILAAADNLDAAISAGDLGAICMAAKVVRHFGVLLEVAPEAHGMALLADDAEETVVEQTLEQSVLEHTLEYVEERLQNWTTIRDALSRLNFMDE